MPEIPPVVTFQSGADLLIALGITDSITVRGVRWIAETHPDWPFGEGRQYDYGKVSNARVMATEPFLAFFRDHPTSGRGPDKKPRRKRGDAE